MSEQQLDAFSSPEELQDLLLQLDKLPDEQRQDVVKRIPAMLQSLMALYTSELRSKGIKDPERLAEHLVITLANYFGGMQLYLPRNDKLALELRNIRIYQQHRGGNTEQLARQYGLTSIQIYHIVREQTVAERARRQLGLF
ncbi:MAG: Mor transcription activator family protein [Rheinheimera sp.]|nr:Mor transcription activator family protein [Rheinheimera sp.]